MKKNLRRLLLLVCVAVFCFSAFKLFEIFMTYKKIDDGNNGVRNEVITETKETPEKPFTVDFAKLKELNEDSIAWLDVYKFDLSYAVVQAPDNDFYLHRDMNKEYSLAGTLFMDYENNSDFSDFNTIIYGHNMKNGSMFGKLKKYKSVDFYKENPYIDIFLEGKKYRYQVFSAHDVSVFSTNTYDNVSTNEGQKQVIINEMMSSALYSTGIEVTTEDKILTLSTCVDSLDDDYRFMVNAKLIEVTDY